MNSVSSTRIRYEDLRSLAFGGISGAYAAVGVAFANPIRSIKVTNDTDATILVSFNGIDDKDVAPASSGYIWDYGSNTCSSPQVDWLKFTKDSHLGIGLRISLRRNF